MPTSREAHELAEECDRLVVTATTPENRALLLKIAKLWRDVAAREAAVETGQAVAIGDRLGDESSAMSVLANGQAEVLLLRKRSRHWRQRALELRMLADDARTTVTRTMFARLANNYDGLADQAELTAINLTESEAV